MKKTPIIAGLAASAFVLAGCATSGSSSAAIPVSSNSLSGGQASNNPSLSVPGKGLHPVIGFEYADKQNTGNSSSVDRFQAVNLDTGIIWQPSLEQEFLVEPFLSVNLSATAMVSRLDIDKETKETMALAGIPYNNDLYDFKIEGTFKPGFLVKRDSILAAFFLQGILKYETGEFSNFRQKVDGTARLYNLVGKDYTYGFGFGGEMQKGSVGKWDVGMSARFDVLFNRTQSIPYTDRQAWIEDIQTVPGGDFYREFVCTFEPYVDYEHIRFSLLAMTDSRYGFQLGYRF
jgi:hypothetical protein